MHRLSRVLVAFLRKLYNKNVLKKTKIYLKFESCKGDIYFLLPTYQTRARVLEQKI